MNFKNAWILVLLAVLTACNYDDLLTRLAPEEESKFAMKYLESLRIKDLEAIKQPLNPALATQDIDARIIEVSNYFPTGEPVEIKLVGAQINVTDSKWTGELSYQYQFAKDWAVGTVTLSKVDNQTSVDGFNVTRMSQSLQETFGFTFANKGPKHYLFLILAIGIPIFILVALVLCIKTPIKKRKWLWILFVLTGFSSASLNWTTGEIAYQALSFQLLGAGAVSAGPYSPWYITITIPVGAMLFLIRRKAISAA